jgi:hypothetical protein
MQTTREEPLNERRYEAREAASGHGRGSFDAELQHIGMRLRCALEVFNSLCLLFASFSTDQAKLSEGSRSPPWTIEECRGISFIVRDANKFAVAYVYFENQLGRRAAANLMIKDQARKIATGIAKLPELLRRPEPT